MCEFRIHWADNGMIHYSWHGTIRKARQEVRRLRRQLCRSPLELNSHQNVVKFELIGSTLKEYIEFAYEHCDGSTDPWELHRMRKAELLDWLNANVREGPLIGRRAA